MDGRTPWEDAPCPDDRRIGGEGSAEADLAYERAVRSFEARHAVPVVPARFSINPAAELPTLNQLLTEAAEAFARKAGKAEPWRSLARSSLTRQVFAGELPRTPIGILARLSAERYTGVCYGESLIEAFEYYGVLTRNVTSLVEV